MATLVTLTDYWSAHRGNPRAVVVNLDLVKTIERLPAHAESETWPEMAERTQLWFGGSGPDKAETVLVTETLADIYDAVREAAS